MKKSLLLIFIFLSIAFCIRAQLKFDLGFTTMGSLKKKFNVGQIPYPNSFNQDTTYLERSYQTGAVCFYFRPVYYMNEIGHSLIGGLSFPINFGISGLGSVNGKSYVNFEYDAAITYSISGGSFYPDDDGYSNFGYFFGLGAGFVRMGGDLEYGTEGKPKSEMKGPIKYLYWDQDEKLVSNFTIGPVLQVGFASSFLSIMGTGGSEGIAISLRPGFGRSFSYGQVSFFFTF